MKKLVFASVMALASIYLVPAPTLRAQDSITIKDPAEFNAYQMAITQSDPKAKCGALEGFLQTYPQSVVKKTVLDSMIDCYQALQDPDKTLSAASRMLQVDPNNMKAILYSVFIKKGQCGKTQDAQTCDDAAALAHKGLLATKSADVTDADWKTQVDAAYPIFHSTIALDDAISKKDFKGAVSEYRTDLMLLKPEQTKVPPGLVDVLYLAEAYTKPDAKDLVQAVWFYCRAWNFAPDAAKAQIEQKIEYYYKRYHGNLEGLDDVKTAAAATVFPPGTFVIKAAATPAEIAHNVVATTPDLNSLNLGDKEFILAAGNKEDADKLWALLKGKTTPVPGIVIEATASVIKMAVTQDAKDAKVPDFIVNMKTPLADKDIPQVGFEFKLQPAAELDGTYDTFTQQIAAAASPTPAAAPVAAPVPAAAAPAPVAAPVPAAAAPAPAAAPVAGAVAPAPAAAPVPGAVAPAPAAAPVPAAATAAQPAQIVLKDGFIQPEKKKAAPAAHKPAAGHHTAH